MGFFTKKEKEKKVETEVTKKGETLMTDTPKVVDVKKDYPYIVQLNDVDGTTAFRKTPFGAKRWIDGANVWLVNEETGFKEPFPEDDDTYKQYKIAEIEAKLKKIDKEINAQKKKTVDTPLRLDLVQDKKVYLGYKKSLELQGKGSYMIVSEEHGGRPLYTFDRKGNFKLPVFKNTDYSLLYVPVEADIALAGDLLKLNFEKNGSGDNHIKLINIVLTVILVIALGAFLWFGYKVIDIPTETLSSLSKLTQSNAILTENMVEWFNSLNQTIEVTNAAPIVTPGGVDVTN